MKTQVVKTSVLFAALAASTLLTACAREISHTESTNKDWFGNTKHTEDSVYKNPDGTITHEHEEVKVK